MAMLSAAKDMFSVGFAIRLVSRYPVGSTATILNVFLST